MPDKIIMLNPGHGGGDPGAVGPTGLHEADVNLEIALRVCKQFKRPGIRTEIIRQTKTARDGGLNEVANKANVLEPTIFLSIHCNAGSEKARGLEVYHRKVNGNDDASNRLARCLFKGIAGTLANATRHPGINSASFCVLRRSKATAAALCEMDFISNAFVEGLMRGYSWLDKAAAGIVAGLNLYIGD